MSEERARRLLRGVVTWAESETNVIALVLTGSRARSDATVDEFCDLDLEVVARALETIESDQTWLDRFGRVLVCLPLDNAPGFPTRLVFYEEGIKVDFTLCDARRVTTMTETGELDDLYERGYAVLVDKEGLTRDLPVPGGSAPTSGLPAQEEFSRVVTEFWFEAAHIPRYLLREELWVVKFRDWTMKLDLLKMLEWRALAAAEKARPDVWHIGTHMRTWVDAATWRDLHGVFGGFDRAGAWHAFVATVRLFRKVARDAAERTGLDYPDELDRRVGAYVLSFADRLGRREAGTSS